MFMTFRCSEEHIYIVLGKGQKRQQPLQHVSPHLLTQDSVFEQSSGHKYKWLEDTFPSTRFELLSYSHSWWRHCHSSVQPGNYVQD